MRSVFTSTSGASKAVSDVRTELRDAEECDVSELAQRTLAAGTRFSGDSATADGTISAKRLMGVHRAGRGDLFGNGRRFRVLDVVPFEEEDESPFVGLLQVEAA